MHRFNRSGHYWGHPGKAGARLALSMLRCNPNAGDSLDSFPPTIKIAVIGPNNGWERANATDTHGA